MGKEVKKVRGQLFDTDTRMLLAEGDVFIARDQLSPSSSPSHKAAIIVDEGYPVDLAGKTCFLQLNQDLAGEVFVTIVDMDVPDDMAFDEETTYHLAFQDPKWGNFDWFYSL